MIITVLLYCSTYIISGFSIHIRIKFRPRNKASLSAIKVKNAGMRSSLKLAACDKPLNPCHTLTKSISIFKEDIDGYSVGAKCDKYGPGQISIVRGQRLIISCSWPSASNLTDFASYLGQYP